MTKRRLKMIREELFHLVVVIGAFLILTSFTQHVGLKWAIAIIIISMDGSWRRVRERVYIEHRVHEDFVFKAEMSLADGNEYVDSLDGKGEGRDIKIGIIVEREPGE